jgi:hypothetical protein
MIYLGTTPLGGQLKNKLFTSSGSFVVPADVYLIWIDASAGGCGGGGGDPIFGGGVRRLVKKAGEKDTVEVVGDSVLVINGITGKWKGKDPRLARVKELVKSELSKVRSWTAAWVPRDQNQEADGIGRKKSGKTLDLRFLDDPAPVARRGFF